MKKFLFFFTFSISIIFNSSSQEITETNTDILYKQALELYKTQDYLNSLQLTNRGLELAPKYHDIRILQVRNYWAFENYDLADKDLDYLLQNAPEYIDVLPLVKQRLNRFEEDTERQDFLIKVQQIYPLDLELQIKKAQLLLKSGERKEARRIAMDLISREGISGSDRYALNIILTRSVSDEIGLNYQYINFSNDYSRDESWQSLSGEYQHNFGRTAVIGRATYSDRGYDNGTLYELEAYPVFSDRFYAFTNLGFSNGEIFPDFRSSLSLFYNFGKVFELEAGGRLLKFNNANYFTGIVGLTVYQGKFFLNVRSFVGPRRAGQVVQNYQGNIRYYFTNADNFLFLRIGSGISPDERTIFTQVQENPRLDAYYGTLGINTTLGVHHIFQIGAGALYEDITTERKGTQLIGNVGYRYRF